MGNDPLLEKAIAFARRVHAGQTDRAGADFIDHPLRVAETVRHEGLNAMIVAVLHDTVEDGDVGATVLRNEGFSDEVVRTVEILTKQGDERWKDHAYARFIDFVASSGSRLAIVVKLADLADNMDMSRFDHEPTDNDLRRQRKYERARERLETALASTDGHPSAASPS